MYLGEAYQSCATDENGNVQCYATVHQVSPTLPQSADYMPPMPAPAPHAASPVPVVPTPAPSPAVVSSPVTAPTPAPSIPIYYSAPAPSPVAAPAPSPVYYEPGAVTAPIPAPDTPTADASQAGAGRWALLALGLLSLLN